MKHFYILILFSSFLFNTFCQDNFITAQTDIKIVEIYDSTKEYVTYKINPIVHKDKDNDSKVKSRKIYIDIPLGLRYNCYYHSGYNDYFIFNDTSAVIIVCNNIHGDSISYNIELIHNKISNARVLKDNQLPNLESNLENGFHISENYLIYYYNVCKDRRDIFNTSIKSKRRRK
jgi:hypothetical protein